MQEFGGRKENTGCTDKTSELAPAFKFDSRGGEACAPNEGHLVLFRCGAVCFRPRANRSEPLPFQWIAGIWPGRLRWEERHWNVQTVLPASSWWKLRELGFRPQEPDQNLMGGSLTAYPHKAGRWPYAVHHSRGIWKLYVLAPWRMSGKCMRKTDQRHHL